MSVVIKHVQVSDLPKAWQKLVAAAKDSCVTVRIEQEPIMAARIPVAEGIAAIQQRVGYRGRRISVEEMHEGVLKEAERRYSKELNKHASLGHQPSRPPRRRG